MFILLQIPHQCLTQFIILQPTTFFVTHIQRLVWETGIPSDRRKAIFMLLSGAAAHSRHHGTEFYRLMIQQSDKPGGVHRVDSEQIDEICNFAADTAVSTEDENVKWGEW